MKNARSRMRMSRIRVATLRRLEIGLLSTSWMGNLIVMCMLLGEIDEVSISTLRTNSQELSFLVLQISQDRHPARLKHLTQQLHQQALAPPAPPA